MRELFDSMFYGLGVLSFLGMLFLPAFLLSEHIALRVSPAAGIATLALAGLLVTTIVCLIWVM